MADIRRILFKILKCHSTQAYFWRDFAHQTISWHTTFHSKITTLHTNLSEKMADGTAFPALIQPRTIIRLDFFPVSKITTKNETHLINSIKVLEKSRQIHRQQEESMKQQLLAFVHSWWVVSLQMIILQPW